MSPLQALFRPESVAVIGASGNESKLGHTVLRNIINGGFPGAVFPVNPGAREILGRTSYPDIKQVPSRVDLAVFVIPAARVVDAARGCGEKGIPYILVISAGFKEIGSEGAKREKELVAVCREYGISLVGPNSLGIMDFHTPLNATFAPAMARAGNIAFLSQSGALGSAILDWSLNVDLGFSRFVSLGNKAGLDEVDFITDAAQDPETEVILCYLENITDGKRFVEAASQVTRHKPVIVLKSGVSQAGARAASSHTGALAGSDIAYDAAFRQCGVFRARSMEELFDLALAFSSQSPPKGRRVAIVTNAGGPGILASDAVELSGLEMARFTGSTLKELRGSLPSESSVYNPVDVLGDAGPERYALALDRVTGDSNVDSVLVLLTPQSGTRAEATARVIIDSHESYPGKPVAAAFMGGNLVAGGMNALKDAGIPCYFDPGRAVSALEGLTRYSGIRYKAIQGDMVVAGNSFRRDQVKGILKRVRQDRRVVLLGSEAAEAAQAYGIPCAPKRLAASPEEAVAAAGLVGFPVVLKISSPQIIHKTDVGGVKTGLETPEQVRRAYLDILENAQRLLPKAEIYGIDVEHMMPPGMEVIIGMNRDSQFGPLLMFGLGGIYVNLLRDVSFRLVNNLDHSGALEMIRETRTYTLLRGYRGQPPRDIDALAGAICRVARLVHDFPDIMELDINPVFAYEQGLAAVDVRITIR